MRERSDRAGPNLFRYFGHRSNLGKYPKGHTPSSSVYRGAACGGYAIRKIQLLNSVRSQLRKAHCCQIGTD
jgi:hypothetical protein